MSAGVAVPVIVVALLVAVMIGGVKLMRLLLALMVAAFIVTSVLDYVPAAARWVGW